MSAAQSQPYPTGITARRDRYGLRHARILYVDDEPLVREAIGRLLHRAGACCLLAGTHDEAVVLAGGEPEPTLALLDYHMPDGPVHRLVTRLHGVRPGLPLIGTSAAARQCDFARLGVALFLEKPWDLADLAQAVDLACSSGPRVRPALRVERWAPGQDAQPD